MQSEIDRGAILYSFYIKYYKEQKNLADRLLRRPDLYNPIGREEASKAPLKEFLGQFDKRAGQRPSRHLKTREDRARPRPG